MQAEVHQHTLPSAACRLDNMPHHRKEHQSQAKIRYQPIVIGACRNIMLLLADRCDLGRI